MPIDVVQPIPVSFCPYCRRIAVSNIQVRRISTTSYWRASAGGNGAKGVWLAMTCRIDSSIAFTPLETTKVTFSTEPSARIATVTIGGT